MGKFNAITGAAINASFITGLSAPSGLALYGNTLYVPGAYEVNGSSRNQTLATFGATTGALSNGDLVTGLNYPSSILVVVPEPSTWILLLAGMTFLVCVIRGRRHVQQNL